MISFGPSLSFSASDTPAVDWDARLQEAIQPGAPDSVQIDALLYISTELYRDLAIAEARLDKYQKLYAIEKRPWYEAVWDSDIAKVVIFCSGVYLGRQMVLVR